MHEITVLNDTAELIRVAIFRKPTRHPHVGSLAWKVLSPSPNGGRSVVAIPDDYQVFVSIPGSPEEQIDADAGSRTPVLSIHDFTSRFRVEPGDGGSGAPVSLIQVHKGLVPGELRIDNDAEVGVWSHIQQDGVDIYRPHALAPGSSFLAAQPATPFYLAVIGGSSSEGCLLAGEEISTTATPILPGQSATVTGSVWSGYEIEVQHG